MHLAAAGSFLAVLRHADCGRYGMHAAAERMKESTARVRLPVGFDCGRERKKKSAEVPGLEGIFARLCFSKTRDPMKETGFARNGTHRPKSLEGNILGKAFLDRMMFTVKGRDFLKLLDYTPAEIEGLLDLARELKEKKKKGIPHKLCEGKNVVLIFEKTSTRTRCAFEVAAHDLGMGTTYLDPSGSQIGKKESIADTARVLASMYDGIEYRGFGQEIVEQLAAYASVPVWNGLTNEFHPTQILADFLTIRERFGRLKGIRLVYMGDARYNMGNSLMVGCAKMGLHFTACSPKEYFPDHALVMQCREIAAQTGAVIDFSSDPSEAVKGADVVYTDIWVSMGEPESVWAERIRALAPYQVNGALMKAAGEQAVFMHCLPSYHDKNTGIGREMCERFGRDSMEVTNEVFESSQSVVFQEAENRMHTIKAVMAATLCD